MRLDIDRFFVNFGYYLRKMRKHKLRFWGVRGSMPTPDSQFMKTGGNTSCVQIETSDGQQLIFDMGTGICNLGSFLKKNNLEKKYPLHIFLSHVHWDHIQGMAFFNFLFDPDCNDK